MSIYNVTAHPLLSEEAALLGSTQLEAHARVAETLLGLLDYTPFDLATQPDLYARASDAVALQISYQVDSGMDAFILTQLTRGGRSMSFRGGRRMPTIHGLAKKIASAIKPRDTATTR